MQYEDTNIISARIDKRNKEKLSLNKIVEIEGVSYKFSRQLIADRFYMTIPDSFNELPPEFARIKYPSENRPPLILSNNDYTVDIFFDYDLNANTQLKDRMASHRATIKRLNPSYVFFTQGANSLKSNVEMSYFDFRSHALDVDIYNLWFLADLSNTNIFGGFSCAINSKDKWEPLLKQMIKTIEPLPQDKEC